MPQKRKPRGRRHQITIYRKIGRSAGKATLKRKKSRQQTGGFL